MVQSVPAHAVRRLEGGVRTRADDPLLTIHDLAARYEVAVKTIRDWRYRRVLPPAIKVGQQVRWRESDLERWEEDQREAAGRAG